MGRVRYETDETLHYLFREGLVASGSAPLEPEQMHRRGAPGRVAFRVPTITLHPESTTYWIPAPDLGWTEVGRDRFLSVFEQRLAERIQQ